MEHHFDRALVELRATQEKTVTNEKEPKSTDASEQTVRGFGRKSDRDYGDYRDTDEGDSSVRAGAFDEGRREPVQPPSHEQSGSTGRATGSGDPAEDGQDSGQGRYGQSGLGGRQSHETMGEKDYRESDADGDASTKSRSNTGSGTAEHETEELRRNRGAEPPKREEKD
jgi:hypothetical protein